MAEDYSGFPPLHITAYSDFYAEPDPKVWGDYWLKQKLSECFKRLGYPLASGAPAILLHLFGEPLLELPSGAYNILWLHSHPDRTTPELLGKYSKVFCISKTFTKKLSAMGADAEFLMLPTDMKPLAREKIYDIVFVGNTRQNAVRKVIGDMKVIADMGDPGFTVKIWGWGWKGLIPDGWYAGGYYENSRLNELYASAKIVLNDHHDDMRREGFINPRVLDVLASGGFVVSDRVFGLDETLEAGIASYETPEELKSLLVKYMNDDEARDAISNKGMETALEHTFERACRTIIAHIKSVRGRASFL